MKTRVAPFAAAALLLALAGPSLAAPAAVSRPTNEFDCMIQPAQVIEIRSPVVGLLQQVHARRGTTIRKGDVLVTIESSVEKSAADTARFRAQAQGNLLQARNKLASSGEKARRFHELYAEEFVSAQARDDAQAELRLAESDLKIAEENAEMARLEHRQSVDQLNRRVIRSPVNGVVVDQYLYPGSLVDTGEGKKPIMKIAQTNVLLVEAMLPFKHFKQVGTGMQVSVIPEPPFADEIRAKVQTVDRLVDSTAGTFGIVAELENAKQTTPAGIRCRVRVPGLK
jgi:RND family efflux transporter MFP subunit